MILAEIEKRLHPHGLTVMGVSHENEDFASVKTAILIGMGSQAWPAFKSSPEYQDNMRDPLDRWSKRLIDAIGDDHGADAVYPSDGPPYPPVIAWALSSGRFWQSPVGMMIHDQAGLMISIRGVLTSRVQLDIEQPDTKPPCNTCAGIPCRSACPVDALDRETGYDVVACKSYLATPAGQDCLAHGCLARRACPVSQRFGRDPDQSAFHMRAFFPQ